MNARRIHSLMREHFPTINIVEHEWMNVADADGLRKDKLSALLSQLFASHELLVEVHRRVGKLLPHTEVVGFIAEHLGQGQIQIANRDFTSFAVITTTGVATAWSRAQASAGAPHG